MRIHSSSFLLLMLFIWLSFSCVDQVVKTDEASLDSLMAAHSSLSGVVLLAEDGIPVYHKAFGYCDPVAGLPSDTAAIFELASVSKTFTSVVVLQLVAAGRLKLDDSLRMFFPELPYPGIRIRHLLNHTSGLPDYQAVMDANWDKSKVAGNEECIEYLIRYHPAALFAPGERYAYSNTGYLILASVAERLTGKGFAELLDSCVFRPASLRTAALRTSIQKRSDPDFVFGFMYDSLKRKVLPADSFPASNYTIWLGNRRGPGRVSASSSDLYRFSRALLAGRIVPPDVLQEAFTSSRLNDGNTSDYGLGWEIYSGSKDSLVVGHSGDNPGYKTLFLIDVSRKKTVILLSNNAYPRLKEIAELLLNR